MKIKTMIRSCVRCGLAATMISLLFTSCRDTISDGGGTTGLNEQKNAISFNTAVLSSQKASRADGTIVNWKQTSLPPSVAHTYYRVDENGAVKSESKTFYAGLFGCYTGPKTWEQLVAMSLKPSPTAAEQDTLNMYYSANQLYNVPATIGTAVSGSNSLTYSPYRLWPNDGKYMTFFGYYPYNPTSAQGDYGIAIVNDENGVGEGKGMGTVHFTMHSDASLQNDFLISAPATNCTRDEYPLQVNSDGTYSPKPVRLNFYHMLAQVRIYAYVRGDDKMVYQKDGEGNDVVADATWFDAWAVDETIKDAWGNVYTKVYANGTDDSEGYAVERTTQKAAFPTEFAANLTKEQFLALELKVPDESQCIRWARGTNWDVTHSRRRAAIDYSMEVNNIKTEAEFFPDYTNPSGATIGYRTGSTLGYATINHYIMNPYWFTFKDNKRERLNDNYMFGQYEDTPAYKRLNASTTMANYDDIDGIDWSNTTKWGTIDDSHRDPMGYLTGKDEDHLNLIKVPDSDPAKHYNFAPGNVILVVPQKLNDDDVPHIVITAKGRNVADTEDLSAKVTINMLKMGINWQSGFIYCYAFLDELMPGDDKVRGPESITVVFDTSQYTDQW